MYSALIIEDENMAAIRLNKMIDEMGLNIESTIIQSATEAIDYLNSQTPDFIYMDIELSDGTAFDVLSNTNSMSPIIFTTAYQQYARQALNAHIHAYILKPIRRHELESATYSLIKSLESRAENSATETIENPECSLIIRYGTQYQVMHMHEIAYIYSEQGLTIVVDHNNNSLPINFTIKDVVKKLNDRNLIMINDSFLVHISAVRDVLGLDSSQIELIIYPPATKQIRLNRKQATSIIDRLKLEKNHS